MTEISIFVNSCKILLCFDMRLFHMVMCLDFVVILLGAKGLISNKLSEKLGPKISY